MFFRRERAKKLTFDDTLSQARAAGFAVQSKGGKTVVERDSIACVLAPGPDDVPYASTKAGVIMGDEIGTLTDQGFQKLFVTPHGKSKPALASDLKSIQNFQEDLKEALGLTSLYNESLGTVSNVYLYDRVKGRDFGHANKPWQAPVQKN